MLPRYFAHLEEYLKPGRVLILYGARRVGKTTLLEHFFSQVTDRYRLDSGDNLRIQELLGSLDFDRILEYAEGYDLIAIDEAQEIPNLGKALKILVDQKKGIRVIATGSSSFNLAQSFGEPLAGRKKTLTLFPMAQVELQQYYTPSELKEHLEDMLIFGSYPDVVVAERKEEKIELIQELIDSYLLRDILTLEQVKNSKILLDLLKLLAFQVGQMVSYHELATQLHIDVKTVARYLDLLEKGFVIYRLRGFSRNLRKEISRKHKYYFLDNGIRNGVIRHFNAPELRDDIGALWENFLFVERLKKTSYGAFYGNRYFWRTYQGQEIDLIEEWDHHLKGYEFKWSPKKGKIAVPKDWATHYPEASFEIIHKNNFLEFVI